MASIVKIKCKNCGIPKKVRTADVKRGWVNFVQKVVKQKNKKNELVNMLIILTELMCMTTMNTHTQQKH